MEGHPRRADAENPMIPSPPQPPHALTLASLSILLLACGPGGPDGSESAGLESGGSPASLIPRLELEATWPEPFSFLNGVRELSDGRVMVADPLSQVVLRIDLDAGTADTLGGVGPGPEEYQQPDRVLRLRGDSTLLVDFGKTYLTVIAPDGSLIGGRTMMVPRESGFPGLLHPRFGDDNGAVYYQPSRSGNGGSADSVAVARFDMETQGVDTAALAWYPAEEQIRTSGHGFLPRLMEPRDDWAAGPDGRVAVIRARDYSVAWHYRDGTVTVGPPHPYPSEPLDRRSKEAYIPEMRASGISMWGAASRGGGEMRMGMSRGLSSDGPGVMEAGTE